MSRGPSPAAPPPPRPVRGILAASGAALAAGLALCLPPADFPFEYHNDEPSKVEQIQSGTRNFRHPVLMLEAADAAVSLAGARGDPQRIAMTGRWLSGVYCAGAAAALAAAVAASCGPGAGLAAGGLFLALPPVFEVSQYFKEDALHLFTLSLLGLCAALRPREPRGSGPLWFPVVCGAALGLAMSARYYAAALAPAVCALVFFSGSRRPWRAAAAALLLALGLTAALHLPWLLKGAPAGEEIAMEFYYISRGHYGIGVAAPHGLYLRQLWNYLPWVAAPLCGWLARLAVRRGKTELVLLGLVLAYLAVISLSPKHSERYALPVLLALCAASAGGLAAAAQYGGLAGRMAAAALLLPPLVVWGSETLELRRDFQRDDRAELAAWIAARLPAGARFAAETQARMEQHLPGRVALSAEFLPDAGSIAELRARGVTHVIIVRDRHHRYTDVSGAAAAGLDPVSRTRRERYLGYYTEGARLWTSPCKAPKPLRPGLDLIAISAPPGGPGP